MIGQCWHRIRHKDVCGVEVQFHALLTSTLRTGKSLDSHYGGFVPAWRAAGTHCKGGSTVPRASLSPSGKEKNLSLLPGVEQQFLTITAGSCHYPGWFNVWWITTVKERGSKLWRPNWGATPAITWRHWGKSPKKSVRLVCVEVKIRKVY